MLLSTNDMNGYSLLFGFANGDQLLPLVKTCPGSLHWLRVSVQKVHTSWFSFTWMRPLEATISFLS